MTNNKRKTVEITVIAEIDGGTMFVNIMEERNRKVATDAWIEG